MRSSHSPYSGALLGFALMGLPGALAAVVSVIVFTAGFVDEPLQYWAVAIALPGLVGAAIGFSIGSAYNRGSAVLVVLSVLTVYALHFFGKVGEVDSLQLAVVGIDGATWEQIEALNAEGELPNLRHLKENGAVGTLKAQEPLFSPLLWTTMAAGKPPTEHGVFGFRVHSDDSRVPRFFDIAEYEGGHTIGTYKWLVTWPPRELPNGGFMVPAWLAPTPETQPSGLSFVKELELSRRLRRQRVEAVRSNSALAWNALKEGLRFSTLLRAGLWSLQERVYEPKEDDREKELNFLRAQIDRDIFSHAVASHEPSITTFTYYPTDALGHRFWKYHEPERYQDVDPEELAAYGDVVRDAYRQADQILGEVMTMLPPDARLVVVSDHGFQALDTAVMGALAVPRTDRLEARLKDEVGVFQVARVGTKITLIPDCDADAPANCGYQLHEKVMAWLPTLKQESTGLPAYKWEEVPDAPDAVAIKLREERVPEGALDSDTIGGEALSRWVEENTRYTGDHSLYGIFGAMGPGVSVGADANVDIVDIAPTLLAAIGLGKGRDMLGRVPDAVWEAPEPVASWDFVVDKLVFENADSDDVNTEMLQALGYLDESE